MKTTFKTGDTVELISGDEKGKKGKVLKIDRQKGRVVVEGLSMLSHYNRKSEKNPKGGITQREGSMHISNVKLVGGSTEKKESKKDEKKTKTAKK